MGVRSVIIKKTKNSCTIINHSNAEAHADGLMLMMLLWKYLLDEHLIFLISVLLLLLGH